MTTTEESPHGAFDTSDPAFLADPYPWFARLREQGPVHWHPGLGLQIAVSHQACDQVLRDRGLGRIWRDQEPAETFAAFNLLHRTSILESEPPTHTRLRRLVAGAFGRGHVERMRPWIERLADDLVAALVADLAAGADAEASGDRADDADGDLIARVAEPLPVEVIAELLGVPLADRGLLRPWSNAIVKMYEYQPALPLQVAAESSAAAFVAYLRALVAERRRAPRENDMISDLVAGRDRGYLRAAADGGSRGDRERDRQRDAGDAAPPAAVAAPCAGPRADRAGDRGDDQVRLLPAAVRADGVPRPPGRRGDGARGRPDRRAAGVCEP
jgi:cytochrome P450